MAAANAELDAVVLAKRKAVFAGNRAVEEALAPAYKEARLRVDVM